MKNLLLLLACLLPLPGFSQEDADASDATRQNQEAAQRLSGILQDLRTLDATVEVLTLGQDGREIQESESRLIMQKPDHISWETLSPYAELMLTDGENIWRVEYDLEQVTIEPFAQDSGRTPLLLLNGDTQSIAASYTVSFAEMDNGSIQRFILYPNAPDRLYERLSLTFSDGVLAEMQFESSLGQKTSLTFIDPQVNGDIDPDVFVFHMPEGLEVIDNTGN